MLFPMQFRYGKFGMRNMQILSRDSDRSNTVGCNIAMFIVQVYSYFCVASGFRMRGGVSLRAVGLLFISQLGRMGEAKGRRKMWRRMRRRSGNMEGEEEEDRDEA